MSQISRKNFLKHAVFIAYEFASGQAKLLTLSRELCQMSVGVREGQIKMAKQQTKQQSNQSAKRQISVAIDGTKNVSVKIEKDQIYLKVLQAAMSLDFKRGHQKWTMAELSRTSGIKRPLIYYYFGKSRAEILLAGVKVLGEECFGLSDRRLKLWENREIEMSIRESRSFIQQHPELSGFYFLHRLRDSPLGAALRELERKYLLKFQRFFPHLEIHQREQMGAFFFGLVFTPQLSENSLQSCLESLKVALRQTPLTAL